MRTNRYRLLSLSLDSCWAISSNSLCGITFNPAYRWQVVSGRHLWEDVKNVRGCAGKFGGKWGPGVKFPGFRVDFPPPGGAFIYGARHGALHFPVRWRHRLRVFSIS